jgi:hypothetical protein
VDLKDIDEWGRELLQSEAIKRGVRNPEVYSRSELIRLILQDYGAPTNVREAARLIGGMLGSAKHVLKSRLGTARRLGGPGLRTYVGAGRDAQSRRREAEAKPYADWARADGSSDTAPREDAVEPYADWARDDKARSRHEAEHEAAPDADWPRDRRSEEDEEALREAERVRAESRDTRRESERVRADARAAGAAYDDDGRGLLKAGWHEVPIARANVPHEWKDTGDLSPWTPEAVDDEAANLNAVAREDELPSSQSGVRRTGVEALLRGGQRDRDSSVELASHSAAPPAAPGHISYGPHPVDGLLLHWNVTPEGIERARKVLGTNGELAVRIVVVRVEPPAVVKTDVIEHGPIKEAGDWTAPLVASEARYVSSIGLRSATRFVSIVHASS